MTPSLYTPLPPTAIYELALGIEEDITIAERHGFDHFTFATIAAQPAVRQRIDQVRAELKTNGAIYRAQCAAVAEELLVEAYKKAMDADSGFAVKMELLKYATRIADLEPKQNAQTVAGAGFSITINLGTHAQRPEAITVEAVPVESLPDTPAWLNTSAVSDDLALLPE